MPAAPLIAAGAAVVGTATAVYGTAKTVSAQNKAQRAGEKQAKYVRAMDNLKAARERRDAIRAARISRGTLVQTAANQGATGSSAALGGLGSIDSQLNSSLSFLDQYNSLSDQASIQAGKVQKYNAQAQTGSAIAGAGMALVANAEGLEGIVKDVFG